MVVRVRRRPAAAAGRAVPRRPAALRGRRARRVRRRGRACAARSSSSPAAPTPPSRSPACCTSAASDEEALELLGNVAGSFAADGLAARIRLEQDPDAADAFAALDAGETERGLDALIAAIAADRRRPARGPAARRRGSARRPRRRAPPGSRVASQARQRAVLGRRGRQLLALDVDVRAARAPSRFGSHQAPLARAAPSRPARASCGRRTRRPARRRRATGRST